MKSALRWVGVLVVAALVAAALGPRLRDYVILHIAGWRAPRVAPNQPVQWAAGPAPVAGAQRPPNIVVILADDLGYNDLSFGGGGVAGGAAPTPNVDSIARDGVNMTQGYAGNATCAPSRAAIMTGRYATRFGFEFTPVPVQFAKVVGGFHSAIPAAPIVYRADLEDAAPALDDMGIPTSEITIAALLKKQGYHSIHLGKWHLGAAPKYKPLAVGFDESLGFYPGASMYLPENSPEVVNSKQDFDPIDRFLWANLPYAVEHNDAAYFRPDEYMTDYLADQAVAAIKANAGRPFFIYLAFNAVHTPLQALKSDYDALPQIADRRLRVYAAMVRALDRGTGKVLAALREQGLEDNTLVIFTSDNGGANYIGLPDINKPYRGWKATFFEGGIHVPFFMKWPGHLPAGASYRHPVAHVDIFATAAAVAGAAMPADRTMDGVDLVPFLNGADPARPHQTLYWRSGDYSTLLDGDWKLQVSGRPNKDWLYDLEHDPTEQHNLAGSEPARLAQLKAVMGEQDKAMAKPLWPALVQVPIPIDTPLGVPFKPGEDYVYWSN